MRTRPTRRLTVIAPVLLAGGAGIYLAARAGGFLGGAMAALAMACALALLSVQSRDDGGVSAGDAFDAVLLAVPGALVVYFAFDSGGYFPASPAVAALLLVVLLVLRVTLADYPFASFGRALAVASCALGLLAAWALASAAWSDAPGRALVEYNRAFAYLLLLVLFGSTVRSSSRLRWLAAGIVAGVVVVAVAALATRLFPDEFPVSVPTIGASTLTYPVTYANALGILCALGGILAFYLTTSLRPATWLRVAAAAALPALAVTIYFTDSRGAMIAAALGLGTYMLLGRPRGLATGLAATLPPAVAAVLAAHSRELLRAEDPTTAAAAEQGHEVAVIVGLCVLAAAVLRLLASPLDRWLAAFSLPARSRRRILTTAWGATGLAVVAVALAAGLPGRIADEYDRFVESADAGPRQEVDESFFDITNRGLLDNWRVGVEAFADAPFTGQGAGTYETAWFERRPPEQAGNPVVDGHSLYVETLAELGAVGFILLLALLATVLIALLPLRRGPQRGLYAALFAVVLAWAAHAGVDWDWEMPVVTAPVIALAGAALAAHRSAVNPRRVPSGLRVGIGLVLLAAAAAPALVLASQQHLNAARDALRAGNCTRAVDRAAASIETLATRPEPYEVLALCQAREGRLRLAIDAMRRAVDRDPDYWRYHHGLGVLRGAAGLSPRAALARARELNPQDGDLQALLADLGRGEAANWGLEVLGPGGATGATP